MLQHSADPAPGQEQNRQKARGRADQARARERRGDRGLGPPAGRSPPSVTGVPARNRATSRRRTAFSACKRRSSRRAIASRSAAGGLRTAAGT